jgi:hypothetical protein
VVVVHGGPEDSTRPELTEQCFGAHKLTTTMRQPVIWVRRRAGSGDEVAAVNPSEVSSLGARRGELEWYNAMRCGIARWRCLLWAGGVSGVIGR